MGFNTSVSEFFLPKMITNILIEKKDTIEKASLIKKIRSLIPLEWRSNFKKLLPLWIQDKMTAYWRMGGIDWNKTIVFSLLADLQGYIRINLRRREKEGVVEEGEDYENICLKIIDGLKSFKDSETGEPVIETIKRKDELFAKGKGFNNLPDLLVRWIDKPAANYKKIISTQFGEIEWPMPGKNPDGRSGNHRFEGFLLAAGENIKQNSSFEKKHIVDLAPTILHILGAKIPEKFEGQAMQEIFYN
jgi:predicted AlkP superfamily phosphohydrolase/phosphomutase